MNKKKISVLQCVLTVISVLAILISNIVVNKQISLPFNIVVSGGLYVFPISYILSDVFSEVYGYKWSRFTCYLTFALNLVMSLIFILVLKSPGAPYFTNQGAFEIVLGNTPRILAASLTAYVMGDFVNDIVFHKMKGNNDSEKGFKTRAFISSVCGGIIDTSVFGLIAFFGQLTIPQIIAINIAETLLKLAYELLILPVTCIVVKKVKKYEEE